MLYLLPLASLFIICCNPFYDRFMGIQFHAKKWALRSQRISFIVKRIKVWNPWADGTQVDLLYPKKLLVGEIVTTDKGEMTSMELVMKEELLNCRRVIIMLHQL